MAQLSDKELNEIFVERLKLLPKVVRDAITSVDIKKQLQELANQHKLHLDQWQVLENEVMLTLLGFDNPENLAENIKKEVNVSDEIAAQLASDISRIVYEPIRQELERQLEHPEAKEKEVSGVEAAREQALGQGSAVSGQLSGDEKTHQAESGKSGKLKAESYPVPGTPPPTPPTEKAIRAPSSGAYKTGEASTLRRDIADDPYREAPQ